MHLGVNLGKSLNRIAKGIAGLGYFIQDLQADYSENHSGTNCLIQKPERAHKLLNISFLVQNF